GLNRQTRSGAAARRAAGRGAFDPHRFRGARDGRSLRRGPRSRPHLSGFRAAAPGANPRSDAAPLQLNADRGLRRAARQADGDRKREGGDRSLARRLGRPFRAGTRGWRQASWRFEMITRRDWLRRTAIFTGATLAALRGRAEAQTPPDPHAGHDMHGMPGMKEQPATPPAQDPHAGHRMGAMQGMAPKPSVAPPSPPAPTRDQVKRLRRELGYTPVTTPNGRSLPWVMKDGVKEFHLIAEPVQAEFAPGMVVNAWGYNGSTPGPTIEAVEGDRVRFYVTNKLPERTSVHWHGILLPNGMDGVSGLNQPHIEPGETYVYEFTLKQNGVFMYHPHSDEMVQMALGMMGFFVIHPRVPEVPKVDRHFVVMLGEWFVAPGTATPNPSVMTDFNLFTFNSRVWPGTDPWVVKKGDRVRFSFGNLSMDSHPIHVHGYEFNEVGTD